METKSEIGSKQELKNQPETFLSSYAKMLLKPRVNSMLRFSGWNLFWGKSWRFDLND